MIQPTFLDNTLSFSLPDSWEKLSQEQLRYVLFALRTFDDVQAKTYLFIRLLGIRVLKKTETGWLCRIRLSFFRKQKFFIQEWQVRYYMQKLDFINEPGFVPVRFEKVGKYHAVDSQLHNVMFSDYIRLENCYQGFLACKDETLLLSMWKLLYRDEKGQYADALRLDQVQLLSVVIWFSAVKNLFSKKFPSFFQKVGDNLGEEQAPDMETVMNAEIRALTEGDVTKERDVLEMDCWRALTELNEKAREAQEFNEKYGH